MKVCFNSGDAWSTTRATRSQLLVSHHGPLEGAMLNRRLALDEQTWTDGD